MRKRWLNFTSLRRLLIGAAVASFALVALLQWEAARSSDRQLGDEPDFQGYSGPPFAFYDAANDMYSARDPQTSQTWIGSQAHYLFHLQQHLSSRMNTTTPSTLVALGAHACDTKLQRWSREQQRRILGADLQPNDADLIIDGAERYLCP